MANKDFIVKNGIQVLGSGSTPATSSQTGALVVTGGVGVQGDAYIGGTLYANGAQVITTASIGSSGVTTITAGTDTVAVNNGGAYTVWNTSTFQSVTNRGATTTNAISITNTSNSVSTTSGALKVSGGVGIGKDLYVGGNTYLQGDLYVDGDQFTLNSTNLNIGDKTITLASATTVAATAAGSGIQISTNTFASILYDGNQTWNVKGNLVPTSNFLLGTSGNPWNGVYSNQVYDNGNRVVTSVTPTAGVGIAIVGLIGTGPSAVFTVTNMGVTSITTGSGISVSTSTGTVNIVSIDTLQLVTGRGNVTSNSISITNTGSTAFVVSGTIVAGPITSNGAAVWTTATLTDDSQLTNGAGYLTSATIGQYGVSSITAGAGISVSTGTGNVIVTNTGVLSLFAGTDTAISSTSGNITIWNTDTLQSVTNRGAVTNNAITITATSDTTGTVGGALAVSGGVAIAKNAYVGGNLVAGQINYGYGNLQNYGPHLSTGTVVGRQLTIQGGNNLVPISLSPWISCTTSTTSTVGTYFANLRQITSIGGTNVEIWNQAISYATKYSLSFYVKYSSTINNFQMVADVQAGSTYDTVTLDGITLQVRSDLGTAPKATITNVGGGLYRLSGIITSGASGTAKFARVVVLGTFIGSETVVASHIQLEAGAGTSAYTETVGLAISEVNNLYVPTGQALVQQGSASLPSYSFAGLSPGNSGIFLNSGINWAIAGTAAGMLANNGVQVLTTGSYSWASAGIAGSSDLFLYRDAANTLALRNGTSGQVLRVYNTFTDVNNYERAYIGWAANRLVIGNEKAGTGASRGVTLQSQSDILIQVNGTTNGWGIGATPHIVPSANNSYDLGSTSYTIRTGYFGATNSTSTVSGALVVTGGAGIGQDVFIGGNLTVGGAVNLYGAINTATNLAGGTAGQILYQTGPGATSFAGPGSNGNILISQGTVGPTFLTTASVYVGNALASNNISGGVAGQIPYQSTTGTTAFITTATAGQVLVSRGSAAPVYQNTLTLADTTVALSSTTGALVVAGGVGIGGSVYIGGGIASTATNNGSLVVTGGVGISGALNAATKSFIIPHPTKPGQSLRHGSLEGPEFGVYVRGRLTGSDTIQLPEYWSKLVDPNTITVEITAMGKYQKLYVKEIIGATAIIIGNDNLLAKAIDCFYTVYGERADVDKLQVEG